jgi:hypothetical protein
VLVDQHRPGLHLVIGDPQTRGVGASFQARTSFAACQASSTVDIDGDRIAENGQMAPT